MQVPGRNIKFPVQFRKQKNKTKDIPVVKNRNCYLKRFQYSRRNGEVFKNRKVNDHRAAETYVGRQIHASHLLIKTA